MVLNVPLWILHSGGIPSASVDGAHSKNHHFKGQFLTVTGRESWLGKNMPFAIMVAPVESSENYTKLANLVKKCKGTNNKVMNQSYMLWSDRNKGKVKQTCSDTTLNCHETKFDSSFQTFSHCVSSHSSTPLPLDLQYTKNGQKVPLVSANFPSTTMELQTNNLLPEPWTDLLCLQPLF